ncbi:hypothetical protein LPJ63_003273 [Coemansia sp. RSA 2711]|nr:hypothetical protein LPJ63_003273 [Coemansia sp. RSA 2711]KAJ2305241.1 hypothetical protein IWW54_005139 [Coemansia sp. RSA 2705]KAJ2313998.1 hypothetical protein IWW52_004404 [Coemansia sp. RSA 2704]KAJ2323328.1 hypothetical protein IWW51_003808 [Coemansia sp. RSA 2702]KAJ2724102.1 hypothetical protein H4R23_004291 [Coemansia sp. Cherry 401B]
MANNTYLNCPKPIDCDVGQIAVLTESGTSCSWECQPNPLYKKPANTKWPIIGGSLGAMVFVLAALFALLLVAYYRKWRRERATYLRDTEDLASELSDVPLLKSAAAYPDAHNSSSAGSSATAANSHAWGVGISKWKAYPDIPFVARAPAPGDAGTELSMDIVDRPPESDPTLAVADGTVPYRQEKTAAAYPLLAKFSHTSDVAESMNQFANAMKRSKGPNQLPEFSENPARSVYEAAKLSGNAAIAAANDSALGSPVTGAFDPFHAVPGVGNSPSLPSRRGSQRTSTHS